MATPYRDDAAALEAALAALELQLQETRARKRELLDAERQERELASEVDALRRRLDQRARRAQPLLESMRVASPCDEPWERMAGDERARSCARCNKDVFDLSRMTRAEAERFLAARGATGACVRLHRRSDGTVITSDCPVGRRRLRVWGLSAVSFGAGLLATTAALLPWRGPVPAMLQPLPTPATLLPPSVETGLIITEEFIDPADAEEAAATTTPSAPRPPASGRAR